MGKYVRTTGEKSRGKPENYACQICRAATEICERCQSSGYQLVRGHNPAVLPRIRRGRTRPGLYNC